ncbi:PDGF-and VEGF-related factor 3-like protein [Euroglyphus maynei]|uniref:PDGF-and VEGF-related factor 3-like protein n=1 Tax=Euroglyphus maynei TaxID=6958 RepID=A0A1Y3BR15_EURMA|nr:PDGF-and VEGF-related factor 3-like protein [Euroglyphus maynei]
MITEDYAKAFDHGVRVRNDGACHQPRPMIIYVNKTDPSKVHLPRGTLLHRCNDQTGCCTNPNENCVPIEMQTIELYFITIQLKVQPTFKNRRIRQSPKIEKLLFTNHTLCGCRVRKSFNNEHNDDDENVIVE